MDNSKKSLRRFFEKKCFDIYIMIIIILISVLYEQIFFYLKLYLPKTVPVCVKMQNKKQQIES